MPWMFDRLEAAFVAVNRWLLVVLLLTMAVIVFCNVVLRYTTGDSLVWAEEVARHLMIWGTFLGAGLVLRFGGHIAIENLHDAVDSGSARVLRAVVAGLIALFCASMAWASLAYAFAMRLQTTPATGISFAYVYAALPAGFVLLLIHLGFIVRRYVASGTLPASPEMDADAAASL